MTDKSVCQLVRLFARPPRRHVRSRDRQWLAGAEMANLTAIDDAVFIDTQLVAEDRVVKRVLVLPDQVVDALLRQAADVVLEIVIPLFCQLARLLEQLGLFPQ